MFIIRRKTPGIKEIKRIVLATDKKPQDLRMMLSRLDREKRWELVKTAIPELDKSKARDMVRFLFSEEMDYIKQKLHSEEDRLLAIECLSYLPAKETVRILVDLLRHKDGNVQLCAAGALKQHTPRLVVPCLVKAMLHEAVLPARAGDVLLAMGYLAQDSILSVYSLALPAVKVAFLELMIQAKNRKCEPFVAQAFESGNEELISKALEAVRVFNFSYLWPQVAGCLSVPSWKVKSKALLVLAELKKEEAIKHVEPLLEDEDDWVRQCAGQCLQALRDNA